MVSLELEARLDNLLSIAQTETADIDLFAPITEKEECPICMIPLLPSDREATFMYCCGKNVCNGCTYKYIFIKLENCASNELKCAFCQQTGNKSGVKPLRKLMKNNNPQAFMQMAFKYKRGEDVIQSDTKALEMITRAAELGEADAFVYIGQCYEQSTAVEPDLSKSIEFLEMGAMKGSLMAHQYLAGFHDNVGNADEAIEHLKVAASAGDKEAWTV